MTVKLKAVARIIYRLTVLLPPRAFLLSAFLLCSVLGALAQQNEPELLIKADHWKRERASEEGRAGHDRDEAQTNFLLSRIRYAFGDHTAPLAFAERAVALNGRAAEYHSQLAEVLSVQAQHAGPLQQLLLARRFRKEIELAIALDPRTFRHRVTLAAVCADRAEWNALYTILREPSQQCPDDLVPYYRAAERLLNGRDAVRAEGYLRAYLR